MRREEGEILDDLEVCWVGGDVHDTLEDDCVGGDDFGGRGCEVVVEDVVVCCIPDRATEIAD